jgi:hypothetical protein
MRRPKYSLMRLSGASRAASPSHSQLEVTIIGPGYGECICVHLGAGRWIVVDSCLGSDRITPASLLYLGSLGVDVASQVDLFVATHWHDDHTQGLIKCLEAYKSARVSIASVLTKSEFARFVKRFQEYPTGLAGSRVAEIDTLLELIVKQPWRFRLASQGKLLLQLSSDQSGHGLPCIVTALSPSDLAEIDFLRIADEMPDPKASLNRRTKSAAPDISPNDASVVLWINVGTQNVLLGADLEEQGKPGVGWQAIIDADNCPAGVAGLFKVPHHGSNTAHHPDVWSKRLARDPWAVVTPWRRGGQFLPQTSDIRRIRSLTSSLLLTARPAARKARRRASMVERALKEMAAQLRSTAGRDGAVRLRTAVDDAQSGWKVELLGEAATAQPH